MTLTSQFLATILKLLASIQFTTIRHEKIAFV